MASKSKKSGGSKLTSFLSKSKSKGKGKTKEPKPEPVMPAFAAEGVVPERDVRDTAEPAPSPDVELKAAVERAMRGIDTPMSSAVIESGGDVRCDSRDTAAALARALLADDKIAVAVMALRRDGAECVVATTRVN